MKTQELSEKKNRYMIHSILGKHKQGLLIFFTVSLIVVITITLIYINSMKDESLLFQFIPNAMAERKPVYLQVFKTQEQVDAIKKTKIYLSEETTIGAGVRLATRGLDIYLKKQLDDPEIHLKYIGPQEKEKVIINNYTYIPDYILTTEPAAVQVLHKKEYVDAARKDKKLTYKENLEIGAVVWCPSTSPCYVISKSGVEDRLIVKPFKSSKPK